MIKKIIKILLIILLIIVLLLGGILIYLAITITDSTNNTPEEIKNNPKEIIEVMHTDAYKAINNDNYKIDFTLSDYELNELIYNIVTKIEIPNVTFSGCYVSFLDEGTIHLELNAKVFTFNSRIQGNLYIEDKDNSYMFTLKQGYLGSLEILNNPITKFAIKNMDVSFLENYFKEKEIDCEINKEDLSFKFSKDSIIKLILNATEDTSTKELISILINILMNHEEIFTVELGKNKKVGFSINYESLVYKEDSDGSITYPLTISQSIKDNVMTSFNQDIATYNNLSSVLTYFINGYNNSTDNVKEDINKTSLPHNNVGIKETHSRDLSSYITYDLNDLPSDIAKGEIKIELTKNNFDSIFGSMDFIGTSLAFTNKTDLAYIEVESLHTTFNDGTFKITLTVNVNGKRISIVGDFKETTSENYTIKACLTSLRIGSLLLDESEQKDILNYLSLVTEDEEYISFDAENKTLEFDLSSTLNSSPIIKTILKTFTTCELHFEGSSNGGALSLNFKN